MNLVLLFSLLFAGFLVDIQSVAAWLRWLHYLSIFFYAFESLLVNELSGLFFSVSVAGYDAIPSIRGETVLGILGIPTGKVTQDVIVLICMQAAFWLACVGVLYLRMPRQVKLVPLTRTV
jgi:ABC-2 type transporter